MGHNSKAPGAYADSPIKESEYVLNGKVAEEMAQLAESDPDLEIKVFRRKPLKSYRGQIKEVYKRVNEWDPKVTLELHFNWLGGAGRIEMIHYPGSKHGENLASTLLTETSKEFSGVKKLLVRGAGDRGGLSLASCKSPCVMTEPFDCSNERHRYEMKKLGHQGLARINYNAVKIHLSNLS